MEPISMDTLLVKLQAARQAASALPHAAVTAPSKQVDFGAMLKGSIDRVDGMQGAASALAEQFQLGDPKVSLEDTMISLQKANISFQAMVQVRNKVVAAYHDIMNLQI
jgi:flagellar hook-basal body complex protein FliE